MRRPGGLRSVRGTWVHTVAGARVAVLTGLMALVVLVSAGGGAWAAPPEAAPQTSALSPARRLDEAKTLFRRGNVLLEAGDEEGALDHFLRSRELVPSYQNTRNAASCLDKLGRFDEALEMYEALIAGFRDQLSETDRAQLAARMADISRRTGRLVIPSKIDGEVFVDGRPRGRLPLERPLRLLTGWRRLRVISEGHLPYETIVDVRHGIDMSVEARLERRRSSLGFTASPAGAMDALSRGWFLEAYGGYAGGGSLGSGAESAVETVCASGTCPGVSGAVVGVRAGYLMRSGLAFELHSGYLTVASTFQRSLEIPSPDGLGAALAVYDLDHLLLLRASYLGAGVSYRMPIGWKLSGLGRLSVALASAQVADGVTGAAYTPDGAEQAPLAIQGRDQVLRATPAFVEPEIGVELAWWRLRVSLSMSMLFSPSVGPVFGDRAIGVDAVCPGPGVEYAERLACAPNKALGEEQAFGSFLLWLPKLAVGSTF
ncbi:Hypothetical protein CAP_8593 [Chondromyces apiculatus DSM 436]|uniref:Uncharacterized protein n=1 Tax=Chondromyces apiculatus DSM 436 TaxID=1192034 RepID=A0A017SX40_9BACT|nr:Hypothetical protein CAP_8593 [Chondromyces apiculatus DSM 436]